MTFTNPGDAEVAHLLERARTIAVVGLSDNPSRPSYGVARALVRFGYRVIPVNPGLASWRGLTAVPDLASVVEEAAPDPIDIVDVFRRPEHVAGIVDECIALGLEGLWLQQGVIDVRAAERARDAGIFVVMDRCLYVERARLV